MVVARDTNGVGDGLRSDGARKGKKSDLKFTYFAVAAHRVYLQQTRLKDGLC